MSVTREPVYAALFDKLRAATWNGSETFAYASRRIALFNEVPAQPALIMVAHDEMIRQRTGQDYIQTWKATAMVYHLAGRDIDAIPTQTDNAILDAIFAAMRPDDVLGNRFTLGGLVHHCFIEGNIRKVGGDLDGQALISIPITILVPSE